MHTYKYIITLSQCFKHQEEKNKGPQKKVKGEKSDPLQQYVYGKFEDYLFLSNCVAYQMYEGVMAQGQSGLSGHDQENTQKVTKTIALMTMA